MKQRPPAPWREQRQESGRRTNGNAHCDRRKLDAKPSVGPNSKHTIRLSKDFSPKLDGRRRLRSVHSPTLCVKVAISLRQLVLRRSQSDRLHAMETKSKTCAAASGSRRTEAARRIGRGEDFLERSGRGQRRQQNQARFHRAVESDEGVQQRLGC